MLRLPAIKRTLRNLILFLILFGRNCQNIGGEIITALIGWVRKNDKDKTQLSLHISVEAFDNAQRYLSQDNKEYVSLIINLAKVQEMLNDERDVASVCQIEQP